MKNFVNSKQDPYLKKDDSDADAFAVLAVLIILAMSVVYYFNG
tara:strand:- start:207 stop:335 length:129 start_codon:yes stop_codon:yes gene_type:complete